MSRPDDIVGYTYRADLYCPRCIVARPIDRPGTTLGRAQAGPRRIGTIQWATQRAEAWLDELAADYGIDRSDERSFDSGEFPKVVFRDQVRVSPPDYCEDTDRCGSCGKVLGS